MPTNPTNWFLYQGDTFAVKDAVLLNEDLTPVDLTGLTASLKVWKNTPFSVYFSGIGISVDYPPTKGEVSWIVGSNDGALLNPGSYVAEVQLSDITGYVATFQIPLVVAPSA